MFVTYEMTYFDFEMAKLNKEKREKKFVYKNKSLVGLTPDLT